MPKIKSLPANTEGVAKDDLVALHNKSENETEKAEIQALMAVAYPVGSVYINATNSTNPATLLGFGTWVAFGAGRVPVGFDATDSNFDAAEETGGAKTHQHTLSDDGYAKADPDGSGNTIHIRQVSGKPSWSRTVSGPTGTVSSASGAGYTDGIALGGNTDAGSTLQPYITVYMWKRTA